MKYMRLAKRHDSSSEKIEAPVHKWVREVADAVRAPDENWPRELLTRVERRQRERAGQRPA